MTHPPPSPHMGGQSVWLDRCSRHLWHLGTSWLASLMGWC